MFVILRPGPYINAETTAGGVPGWVTSSVEGELRTNASGFREAWELYLGGVVDAFGRYQVTNDGPVIGGNWESRSSVKS